MTRERAMGQSRRGAGSALARCEPQNTINSIMGRVGSYVLFVNVRHSLGYFDLSAFPSFMNTFLLALSLP